MRVKGKLHELIDRTAKLCLCLSFLAVDFCCGCDYASGPAALRCSTSHNNASFSPLTSHDVNVPAIAGKKLLLLLISCLKEN